MAQKKNPLVIGGSTYINGKFVSKRHVAQALKDTGFVVLAKPPKDADADLALGRILGKRDSIGLQTLAKKRGMAVKSIDDLMKPARAKSALMKALRASDKKLLSSEAKLLEELTPKKKSA